MGLIKPTTPGEAVTCFADGGEMEFLMPETQTQSHVHFRCQVCGIIYQIPIDETKKKVRISLEVVNEKTVS